MNFFAGLLLLLMPEENAFWYGEEASISTCTYIMFSYMALHWYEQSDFCCDNELTFVLLKYLRTLVGVIDDYFDGYYTEEMIESQVPKFMESDFVYFLLNNLSWKMYINHHFFFKVDQLVFEELMRERFPKLG